MVNCDRCHRRFSSYAGLEQHYKTRHSHAQLQEGFQSHLREERRLESGLKPTTFTHKTSRTRLAALLLVLIAAAAVIGVVAMRAPDLTAKTVRAGSVAPDFSLYDTAGGRFTLSDYKGKSNVMLFFNEGLACSPCLQQMQALDQLNPQLTDMNITVASVTTDSMSQLSSWAQASGPKDSKVLSDQSLAVSQSYDMLGNSMHAGQVPGHTFMLINKSGMVVWRHDYYPPSMYVPNDQLLSDIKQAMGA